METARELPFFAVWSAVNEDGAMGPEGWVVGSGSHTLMYGAEFIGGVIASVAATLVFLLNDLYIFTILELKKKLGKDVLSLGFYFRSIE